MTDDPETARRKAAEAIRDIVRAFKLPPDSAVTFRPVSGEGETTVLQAGELLRRIERRFGA